MSMAGMWFEYVWDQDFNDGFDYQCSTWLILDDGNDGFVVYNHQTFDSEDPNNTGTFNQFKLNWDKKTDDGQRARAEYVRGIAEEGQPERK